MAPSSKGKRKKKPDPMAEKESQRTLELCPAPEMAVKSSDAGEPQKMPEELEPVQSPRSKGDGPSEGDLKALADESGDEPMLSSEKEEEQTFLVNLYKFMKERHTPIERVPHLGFKQINLFKIYKVVEKLGAYELVTGRRLWKNVYDMLGGSPGSTSAATCTRRHYERLVLPYVRHLKGEDDKPLPPVKPRKQYKISKKPKGDNEAPPAEKKRARKEKSKDQVPAEKQTPEGVASDPKPANGFEQNRSPERNGGRLSPRNGPETPERKTPDDCHGHCRAHNGSDAYARLFSSFYFKGNHGIMSPLAKKKLLAQVSKDEALRCHGKHLSHCPEYQKAGNHEASGADPGAGTRWGGRCRQERQGHEGAELEGPVGPQVSRGKEGTARVPPSFKEGHVPLKTEGGGSGGCPPPAFSSPRYASRSDVTTPGRGHRLHAPVEPYPGWRDPSSLPSPHQQLGKIALPPKREEEGPEDQPEDLRRKPPRPLSPSWRGESEPPPTFPRGGHSSKRGPSPFAHLRPSWGAPAANLAKVNPQLPKGGGPGGAASLGPKRRGLDEDLSTGAKRLKVVSPFIREAEPGSPGERGPSPRSPPRLAKPKATMARPAFSVAPVPRGQEMYKGMVVRLPLDFGNPGDPLKGQPPSLFPSLSLSPVLIPAFPTPLLTASVQPSDFAQPLRTGPVHCPSPYDGPLRQRLYPLSPWHSPPAYAAPHVPAFHRNAEL